MLRQVIPLAALGLFLVPDWATATGRRRFCPPPVPPCPPPLIAVAPPFLPVFDACPVPVYPAPLVLAAPPAASTTAPSPKAAPRVEADGPSTPAPKLPPAPKADPAQPFRPAVPPLGAPPDESRPGDTPKLPPVGVPPSPPAKEPSPLNLPPIGDPKVNTPVEPQPKAAPGGDPKLPPLTLPPVERTSGSSPVAAREPDVRLVPSAGDPPADPAARRAVTFVNLTAAEVVVTVGGESAVLPARHELTATVPAKFRWRLNGGAARAEEVPAAAPGAEVVIK